MGDFRQLSVWQRSHLLAVKVHQLTTAFPLIERYGLAAQMRRAAVSIISNIAEGCGRQSDRELAYFLRIARGPFVNSSASSCSHEIWTISRRRPEGISTKGVTRSAEC